MADQDQVPQNSIPPKASPFAKPEGAAPAAVPGAPRPITVRLKPVAPAAAVIPPAAPSQEANLRVTARVNLTDVDMSAPAVVMPQGASPRVTARVNLADLDVPTETPLSSTAPIAGVPAAVSPAAPAITPAGGSAIKPAAAIPATVRLRPVAPPAAAGAPAITPASAAHAPQHPPAPGSNPIPNGPKPSSNAQLQAAKSKTSRISLDSAIGVAPVAPMTADKNEPKTIRLKRPADLGVPVSAPAKTPTAPIRQTSRIPDAALPTESGESASVTQKKTLKIKRPGALKEEAAASESAASEAFPEGVQLMPIAAIEAEAPKEASPVFTAIAMVAALAALFVVAALTYCLVAQVVAPVADKNTVASFSGPDLPWPGKMSD